MTNSIITKKVIAKAFKDLMEVQPFSKISVSDIMSRANMRRQTFYYHFQDKFELLHWIYKQETKEHSIDFLAYDDIQTIFRHLLHYFYENQTFYQRAMDVNGQNGFSDYLYEHIQTLYLNEIDRLSQKDREFISSFYSYGVVGIIHQWLQAHCPQEPDVIADHLYHLIHKPWQWSIQQESESSGEEV